MALTLEQILNPITVEDATQFMIDVLRSVGFSGAASWQSGSLARTVGIEVPARVMSNVHQIIVTYGKAGYNETAIGDWLTVFSVSQYDNQRHAPVKTRGYEVLGSGDIAHSVGAGDMLFAAVTAPSSGTAQSLRTYRNLEAFTLPPHTVGKTIAIEAEVAGSASNVAINEITILQTSYAGVTVNNPGVDGEWITQAGADAETDDALRARNRTKWASKAYATPEAGYENYAREADASITRVFVDGQNPAGPGSVRIYVAGPQGASNADSAQEVLDYIEGVTDGICRRPLCAILSCMPAVELPVYITGTVYVASAYNLDGFEDTVEKALDEFFSTIPIGGTKTTGAGCVFFSALYMAVMVVPGVVNVIFTSPTGDIVLAPEQVPVETTALTYVVI